MAQEWHVDVSEFRAMLGRSSVASAEFQAALRRSVRDVGKQAADVAKTEVMEPPDSSGNGPHTGLRDRIRDGIKVSVLTGIKTAGVEVKSTGFLAKQYQRPSGWRHPVYGNRDNWVSQHGHDYWTPMLRERAKYEAEIQAVLGEAWGRFDGK